MSDDFLKSLEKIDNKKPSTLLTTAESRKRKLELSHEASKTKQLRRYQNKVERKMEQHQLEDDRRREGLNTKISDVDKNNIGLKLMKKMGFKEGDCLGQGGKRKTMNYGMVEAVADSDSSFENSRRPAFNTFQPIIEPIQINFKPNFDKKKWAEVDYLWVRILNSFS